LNWGYFFPSTSTISIAFAGHSLLHKPQPIQSLKLNTGRPRKSSGNRGFTKGYLVVAGLAKMFDTTLFNIGGTRNFFAIFTPPPNCILAKASGVGLFFYGGRADLYVQALSGAVALFIFEH
jgi:hypothetical protein